tara:strand:- start:1680 stop:2234 length:555 start_codon:yes stop_codon:yes gene_type:complete
MSHHLVPLKVTIGLAVKGGKKTHDFPNFNSLSADLRDNMDWSEFVDQYGGWHYDQVSGHADDDTASGSPSGTWVGMLLVPRAFADAAVVSFSSQCSIINEVAAESFYQDRAHIRDPEVREDLTSLQAIAAKRQLGMAEDADDLRALDPDHPQSGRRRNLNKTWEGFKTCCGIEVEDDLKKPVVR